MACILPASELGGKASLAEVPIPFPVCSVSSDWKTLCNERKKKKKKNLPAVQETQVQSLGWEEPLEKEMAIYSSILA